MPTTNATASRNVADLKICMYVFVYLTSAAAVLIHFVPHAFVSLRSAGQQGQQPQDYTKAWEEYYKKQGKCPDASGWPGVSGFQGG